MNRASAFAVLFVALFANSLGCEVNRGQIPGAGGGGVGGASTTTSSAGGASGTGGASTSSSTGGSGGAGGDGGTGGTSTTSSTGGNGGVGGTGGAGGTGAAGGAGTTSSTGGAGGTGGTACVPVDDAKACTDDVCENGLPVNKPTPVGSPCSMGGTQCDGNGTCVECLAPTDCAGTDDPCQTRTCVQGKCDKNFAVAGTALPTQVAGDCKKNVCDGQGAAIPEIDDADLPDDSNACTTDVCTAGVPANPNKALGTVCGVALVCTASAACVGCNMPSECSGDDDECKVRTCVNNVCGVVFTAAGTAVAAQTVNNCLEAACDGNGAISDFDDDADVPLDDGNACTNDVCSAGAPIHPAKPDGSSCTDGDACTQADTCQAGSCASGAAVTCPTPDQCHTAGSCGAATGVCSNPIKVDGSACNDGNACTQSDTCQAGICVGANPVTCGALDQCHIAGSCDSLTGLCSNPNKADGSGCSDGNGCTQTDTCQAGTCIGTAPVTCSAQDQCHTAGTCDSATGLCSNPTKADGFSCNDGTACTLTDTCQAGTCTGTAPVICAAQDQCHTAGSCDPVTGFCSNPNTLDGASCSDGNACTLTDTCQGGACSGAAPVICLAQDQCHTGGTCDPATGACSNPNKANGSTCTDGSACTLLDTCQNGACAAGAPITCAAPDQCHTAGTCNPADGVCSNPNKANGSACTDGNACTVTDTCQAGACSPGAQTACAPQNECQGPGLCNPTTGICSNPNKANGSACSDGNACTVTDTCQAGTCNAGIAITCAALDQCHDVGTCDSATGVCSNPTKANGTAVAAQTPGDCKKSVCDGAGSVVVQTDDTDEEDGLPCTQDTCSGGVPTHSFYPLGSAGTLPEEACLDDACDGAGGVILASTAAGTGCAEDGGNACDGNGACVRTFMLYKVGTGAAALGSAATASFLEEYAFDGTFIDSADLPTVVSGSNFRLTLSGTAVAEGNLSRSQDGKYVVGGGYDAAVGTAGVAGTTAAAIQRVLGRIDRNYTVDTSTKLTTAFSGSNIRSACTSDGTDLWASGTSSGTTGGVWHTTFGAVDAGTQVLAAPNNARFCHVYLNQLYGGAGSSPFFNVFSVGPGLPATSGQTATVLSGLPNTASQSIYSFVVLDTTGDSVPDLLYVADDRSGTVGGVYKYSSADGVAWVAGTPARTALTPTSGARGLAGYYDAGVVKLVATGTATATNAVVVLTDDLSGAAMAQATLFSAPTNTVYRGAALGPTP